MRAHGSLRWLAVAGLLLAAVAGHWACGGGGSGSDGTSSGQVALLVTDAEVAAYKSMEVTVTEVLLLAKDLPPQSIWSGSETLDFLDLSEHAELFTVAEGVPAGAYDKIRLVVPGDVTAVTVTDETETFTVPGTKIDLNPTGEFQVVGGETLYLQLDFDMAKTLAVSSGGVFRPVVFVTLLGAEATGTDGERLVRVRGEIESVAETFFVLCHPTVKDADYCVDVLTAGAADYTFKDLDGALDLAEVLPTDVGATAVAYGKADLAAEALDAVVVEVGENFLQRPLKGTLDAVAAGELTFTVADGQGAVDDGTQVTVDSSLARLFDCRGAELAAGDLAALVDSEARVDGVVRGPTNVDATIVIVRVCAADQSQEGEVASLDAETLRAEIRVQTTEMLCAQFRADSEVFVESPVDGDGAATELRSVGFEGLQEGWTVRVFGEPDGDAGCFGVNAAVRTNY